uniref:hypothetical protein n=1 Tax=Zhouia sp. PK063 TaxID=3373602 RepID=UPI0037DDB4DB
MAKAIDRILYLIKSMGLSARQFDLSIGASNGYTLRMIKNNASVGSDVLEKIIEKYPHVNVNWLITGRGEMFYSNTSISEMDKESISAKEIEALIEKKLTETDDDFSNQLLEEIRKEIEATQKKLENN